jgi:hypothetical protein
VDKNFQRQWAGCIAAKLRQLAQGKFARQHRAFDPEPLREGHALR